MPRPSDVVLRRERFVRRLIFERKHKRQRPHGLPPVVVVETVWVSVGKTEKEGGKKL